MAIKPSEVKKSALSEDDIKKIDEIEELIDAELSKSKLEIESSKIESHFSDKSDEQKHLYEVEIIRRYKDADWLITEKEIKKIKHWVFTPEKPKKKP